MRKNKFSVNQGFFEYSYFNDDYDADRMLEKLNLCSGLMNEQPTRDLIRKEIEKVYNYRVTNKNKKFFGR